MVARTRGAGIAVPLATWAGLTALVVALQHVSNRVLREPHYRFGRTGELRYYLDGLVQFDGHRYIAIATDGYSYTPGEQSPIAWFPLYPLLMRWTEPLTGDPLVSGVLVTVLGCGGALVLYWTWLGRHHVDGPARLLGFALFAVYPYSWFLYGVVYGEALFLLLALAALLLAEDDHPWLAGVAGALATAARPTGLVLVPALVAITAVRHGVLPVHTAGHDGPARVGRVGAVLRSSADRLEMPHRIVWSRARIATVAPALSILGLVAYMVYLQRAFGDPLAWYTNQETFHGRYPQLKLTFLSRLVHARDTPVYTATITLQAVLAVAVLLSAPRVARRFGFPLAVLVVLAVAVPVWGTHDFMGTGRYLLTAFPAFAVAGEALAARPRWIGRAVVGASATLMLVMAFGFSRSAYLS